MSPRQLSSTWSRHSANTAFQSGFSTNAARTNSGTVASTQRTVVRKSGETESAISPPTTKLPAQNALARTRKR